MATVRVSFLLGGERFHGRLNRSSVLSDVPAKATRVNRAGPGYKVIRLRGLSHTDNMARTRQYFHVATDEGLSFPLRLQRGDPHTESPDLPKRVVAVLPRWKLPSGP
jgi:hypothetical protein